MYRVGFALRSCGGSQLSGQRTTLVIFTSLQVRGFTASSRPTKTLLGRGPALNRSTYDNTLHTRMSYCNGTVNRTRFAFLSTTEGDIFSVAKEEMERARQHFENRNFTQALTEYQKARQLRADILGKDHYLVADSDYCIGVAYANAGDLPSALANYLQALALQKSTLEDLHPAIGLTYRDIAIVHVYMGNYHEAIEAGRQAQRVYEANLSRVVIDESQTEARLEFQSALGMVHLYIAQAFSRQYKYNDAISEYRLSIAYLEECHGSHPQTIKVQNETADLWVLMNLPQEALPLYQKSADMTEAIYGAESEAHSDALANLGDTYLHMPNEGNNHNEGLKAIRKSLEIADKVCSSNLDKLGRRHHELGSALAKHGKYQEAVDMDQKAAKLISELVGGNPDTRVGLIHTSIAKSYDAMKQYDQAKKEFEKSLAIHYACQGDGSDEIGANNTCATHVDFGMMLRAMGDFEAALQNDQKALKLSEKALGENHPVTATCHYNIGQDLSALERFLEASHAYMRAHRIDLSVYGNVHKVITTAKYAAEDLVRHARKTIAESGDHKQAVEFFVQAANILESALGEHQSDTVDAYLMVGEQYDLMDEWQESMKWSVKAWESYKVILGEEDERTVMSGKNVALLLWKLGRTDEALQEYRKALAALVSLHGKSHLEVAETHRQIGKLLMEKEAFAPALVEFREAHKVWEELLGNDEDDTYLLPRSHVENLFQTLACLGDFDGALAELEKGKELLLKKEKGEDLAVCWMNIAELLNRKGDKVGALHAYREADAVYADIEDGQTTYENRQQAAKMIQFLASTNECLQ